MVFGGFLLFVVVLIWLNWSSFKMNDAAAPSLPAPDGWEGQVARITNAERSSRGLAQLVFDAKLADISRAHSADMNNRQFFDHNNPSGETPEDRARKAAYTWGAIGENIAAGYGTPEAVVRGWMNSPGHRSNILGTSYKRIGVGATARRDGTPIWTQMFSD